MKNTVMKYETEELDEFIVSDYFSKSIDVWSIFSEIESYLSIYKMDNGDKLERVSYELYGTTDYWDVLLLINDRTPLFDMPYDFETLSETALANVNYYKNFIYDNAPLNQSRVDEFYTELMSEVQNENEFFRYIYVVKQSKINDFVSLLKDKGYI